MQAFVSKVVAWVIAVDPATLKWSAAVLLALFFGLVLFGLFRYQAYDRKWGLQLVLGLAGVALVAGLGASLHWTLGLLYGVGYGLTWLVWVLTRPLTGWRQHVLRGLAAALCFGPWLWLGTTECSIIWVLSHYPAEAGSLVAHTGLEVFFMLPGVFWAAALVGGWSWWRANRRETPGRSTTARRVLLVALVLVNLLGLNWYVAGRVHADTACDNGQAWTVAYVVFSRPGSASRTLPDGSTLLHLAVVAVGPADQVRVLLAAGAKVKVKEKYHGGNTPLHLAALFGFPDKARLLLAAGAEVNARDDGGATALDLALAPPEPYFHKDNHQAVVKALRAAGAKTGAELDAEKAKPAPAPATPEPVDEEARPPN